MAYSIRKKDKVVILGGRDRGKRSEVVRVLPREARVVVQKVNMVKKHQRTRGDQPGGIVKMEAPLPLSRVALVCPRCEQPTRPKWQFLEDGSKIRLCRKCGEQIL